MGKKISAILILFLLFFTPQANAQNVAGSENNNCGLHLNQREEGDIAAAAELCNSNGGDWGKVVITLQDDIIGNVDELNNTFNLLRKYHLEPIIRLATHLCGDSWCQPTLDDSTRWVNFLTSPRLYWPTSQKRIILFNEVNHAKEWGGVTDPKSYADVAQRFCTDFKTADSNFFVMLAGFDASNPTMDEAIYLQQLVSYKPEIFDCIDGWTSHSYPNPGFRSSPHGLGRGSIRTYEWEMNLLKRLGVKKDYCVYNTETGWPHSEGTSIDNRYLPVDTVAKYTGILSAMLNADPKICSYNFFIINDQSELFEHFSWKLPGNLGMYSQAEELKKIPKVRGNPKQQILINIKGDLPKRPVADSVFNVNLKLTNGGQAWLDMADGYRLGLIEGDIISTFSPIVDIQSGNSKEIDFKFKTGVNIGEQCAKVGLFKNDKIIMELFEWCFKVLPQPSLDFSIGTFLKTNGEVELKFIDKWGKVVYSIITQVDYVGHLESLKNLVVGDVYRVLVNKKYYLPVESSLTLQEGNNRMRFPAMIPIDFNGDGKFTLSDLLPIKK
ncbi:hypothetical protein A3H78_00710 [Candidatus Roizmanbacteria bacterium RIFCSPLOWO2_02_FULL_36_11]|uniref:Asl1-like glycosyl hydrolase catalytic domain-containing protein n=1 Tax=Candidatus Roizmanbacteria bacterium RIFCSPLOWO2_02_FULL_36_11 TaxID=1802071 RepID=A0A1F7JH93_9BACT|nr:MAG: hypothetical protein A3H78_00710 [Candidatus Roizmanbacteria bacterium RIFCSPLOWO2_02_FULL_36_11]